MPKRNVLRHRYPGGKPIPLKQMETASPAMVRQIIDSARRGAGNPLLRSEIGRLRLNDVLFDRQVSAGQRFAILAGFYARVKGFPRSSVASPSYEMGYGGKGGFGDVEDDEIVEALAKAKGDIEAVMQYSDRLTKIIGVTKRYEAALEALNALPNKIAHFVNSEVFYRSKASRVVIEVAVMDRHIPAEDHRYLKEGLSALADHFAIHVGAR